MLIEKIYEIQMQELEAKMKKGEMSPSSQRKLQLQLDKSGQVNGGSQN